MPGVGPEPLYRICMSKTAEEGWETSGRKDVQGYGYGGEDGVEGVHCPAGLEVDEPGVEEG